MAFYQSKSLLLQMAAICLTVLSTASGCTLSKELGLASKYFEPAGHLALPQAYTRGVLLQDGRILITSHRQVLYDPETQQSQPIKNPLTSPENDGVNSYSQTLLPNGKVVILGHFLRRNGATAQVFDPETNALTELHYQGSYKGRRVFSNHTANLLPNGEILVWGGYFSKYSMVVQLYNPSKNSIKDVLPLSIPRYNHASTSLPDGDVLIVAGTNAERGIPRYPILDVERYDWQTNTVKTIGQIQVGRENPSLIWLNADEFLIVGGRTPENHLTLDLEVYNLRTNASRIVAQLKTAEHRGNYQPVKLPNGDILLTGGRYKRTYYAEIYNPVTQKVTQIEPLMTQRYNHAAIGMPNGDVYVLGGMSGNRPEQSVEKFNYKEYLKWQRSAR